MSDHVYVKGDLSGQPDLEQQKIWKYSIAENGWSSLPTPIVKTHHYTLVNFQSQLLCIGGYESPCVNNTYPLNKEIFALDGNGWKKCGTIPDLDIPFSNVSAACEGNRIMLAWKKDTRVMICTTTLTEMRGSQK